MRQIVGLLVLLWAVPALLGTITEAPKKLPAVDQGVKVIHNLDEDECVPRLLCEMAVSAKVAPLSREEASILAIFRPLLDEDDKLMAAPLKVYRTAVATGNAPKANDESCVRIFKKCPLDGHQLRMAFKSIHTPKL